MVDEIQKKDTVAVGWPPVEARGTAVGKGKNGENNFKRNQEKKGVREMGERKLNS